MGMIVGVWTTGRRLFRKTRKEPAKFVYCVLFSPLLLKSVPDWPAISVSSWEEESLGQMILFGRLSAICLFHSELAGWGERVSWAKSSGPLHSITPGSGREAGRGVAFPTLGLIRVAITFFSHPVVSTLRFLSTCLTELSRCIRGSK